MVAGAVHTTALLLLMLASSGVRAQEGSGEHTEQTDAWNDADFSATTTARPAWADAPSGGSESEYEPPDAIAAGASLPTELERMPGLAVRRTGGPGDSAFIALRGSEPFHVRVLLDGIPLNGALNTSVDFSGLPLDLFHRVTVYRSQAPVQAGAPLPGGVISLQLADRFDGVRVNAGAGSFGFRRASATGGVSSRAGTTTMHGGYIGSRNDFQFFDDNGTPLNTADDAIERRQNNGFDMGTALLAHRARLGRWRLNAFGLGTYRHAGVAGIATVQNTATELTNWRGLLGLGASAHRLAGGALDLDLLASAGIESSDFDDPLAETSLLPQNTSQRATTALLSARPSWWIHPQLAGYAIVEWQNEHALFRDADATLGLQEATRNTLAVGAELEAFLFDDRLRARAGVRTDHQRNQAAGQLSQTDPTVEAARTLISPQAGAGLRVVRAPSWMLDLYGSISAAERAPSFFELYGIQGTVVGNPSLQAESRFGGDAGLRAGSVDGTIHWQAQYAAFARRIDDLIVFVENGQGIAIPQNLRAATISGHEAQLGLGWLTHLQLDVSYTFLDAVQRSEDPTLHLRQLPYRSRHQGTLELAGGIRELQVAWRLDAVGQWFLDERQRRPIPTRVLQNIDVTVAPPLPIELTLILSVANLTDERTQQISLPDGGTQVSVPRAVADYSGFPLPGRSFFVTLVYRGRSDEGFGD